MKTVLGPRSGTILRHQGTGQLIGRVLESEAIETMLLGGGFRALSGLIEVLLSLLVLAAGRLPLAHLIESGAGQRQRGGDGWQSHRETSGS